jgi:hypothetical protein
LFTSEKLYESGYSFSRQLFNIEDNKSLIKNFKKIQVSFQEIGGYQHSNPEQMNITITPVVGNISAYDNFMNKIDSTTYETPDNITISFYVGFSSNEKKYASIIYDDVPSNNITYTSNVTETNVTGIALSGEDVQVLSQDRCSNLRSLGYEGAKSQFGFPNDFRITGCYFGETPPQSNVIVRSIPMIIERSDGTLYSNFTEIMVW